MSILNFLVDKNIVKKSEVASLEEDMQKKGESLEGILLKRGLGSEQIAALKGEYLQVPVRNLEGTNVPFDILQYIPEESALYYKIVPIALKDGVLEVGLTDPDNIEARDAVNFIASKINMPIKLFL